MIIKYNSSTYNLSNENGDLEIIQNNDTYLYKANHRNIYQMELKYENILIKIESKINDILIIFVILQYIFKVNTIKDLSKLKWNFSQWKITIKTTGKKTSDHAKILNYLLNNIENFNKPLKINDLEKNVTLNDKRGWVGERPREIYYKYGFPYFTPSTLKTLKNGERLFECPFPICNINPIRKAICINNNLLNKCFTCGIKEGEKNLFGKICKFEKGHLEPHILSKNNLARKQCKWCNTFYKDKIIWDIKTYKPKFNIYAILRDTSKNILIKELKKLGFSPEDLK